MKNRLILFCISSLFALMLFSQDKQILGDTIFWEERNDSFSKEAGLPDFTRTNDDFNFRLENMGQIVEICKNEDIISGALINYIYKLDKDYNKQRIFRKDSIPTYLAEKAYHTINDSGILNLASSRNIKGWQQGFDGITYTIEHADKEKYWYKWYWTPTSQDSLPEALLVQNFVNELSRLLSLRDKYDAYKKTLPRRGCYTSGGMITTCYIPINYHVGYSGSLRMPYGYEAVTNITYLGNLKLNAGLRITHRFGKNGSYDFSILGAKTNIFVRKGGKATDYLWYNYRQRRLHYIENGQTVSRTHKINYGLTFKYFSAALGTDIYNAESTQAGVYTSAITSSLPFITIAGESSFFKDRIDYKFAISRNFYFGNSKSIFKGLNVNLFFETFLKHSDAGMSVALYMY